MARHTQHARVVKLKSWRFATTEEQNDLDGRSLIEVLVVHRTVLEVTHAPSNPYPSGVSFSTVSGPELDGDVLWDLAADLERMSASRFVPIRARHFDPEGDA